MKPRTTTALVAAMAVITLNCTSARAADSITSTNGPVLKPLRMKSVTWTGTWSPVNPPGKPLPANEPVTNRPALSYGPWAQQSDAPRSVALIQFKGPIIRGIGGKGPEHGMADVLVDGKPVQAFDAYAPTAAAGQLLFEVSGVETSRIHEVRVVLKRDKNAKSSGNRQIIESFEAADLGDYAQMLAQLGAAEMKQIVAGEKTYLKPEQWKPVAYAATAPLNGVTLDGGPLREAFDRNINYLNRCFKMTGQYKGKNPGMGWDGYLPGSGDGKMLGGAGNTLRWGEREDMRAIVDAVVGVVKARQREDGYCMSFPEEHMASQGNAWNDERRNYARVHLTRGMVTAGLVGNKDALPVMRKFYDWLYASPYLPKLIAGKHGCGSAHNCNNGYEGSLLMYFSPVGKPEDLVNIERYWTQDFFIEEARKAEPWSLCSYPYHVPHSYVLLAYKAWLDQYRGTGASKYLEGAKGAWEIVHDHYLTHGAITICEGDRSPPDMFYIRHTEATDPKYKGKHHPGETCGTVFWTDINHRLLQFYPDEAKYADQIETAIYNVMLGVQNPEGDIRYHTVHVGNKAKGTCMNTCCEVFGSPLIAALPQYLYSVAPDGLYVNLYAPSSITTKQLTLKTTTDFPASGKVEIKVEGTGKLRVRIPSWVTGGVPVNVNGKTVATGKPGSYVTIDKPTGTVNFELPMQFRTVLYTGADQSPDHDTYSLLYGPVLMALVGADDLDIPAKDLAGKLKPVEGKPLQFSVAGKDGVHYQPYWRLQTEVFTCFPTLR